MGTNCFSQSGTSTKQRKRGGEAEGRREEGESTPKELQPSAPEAARCPETDGKQKRQASTRWSPISFFVGCWFEMMHINKHTHRHTTDPHRRGRMEAVSQNYASQVNPDDRIRMDDDGWWIRFPGSKKQVTVRRVRFKDWNNPGSYSSWEAARGQSSW